MEKVEEQLDPWIRSYIAVHYPRQTRYEIDRYLIDVGYDPKAIDAVWQVILPTPVLKAIPEHHAFSELLRSPDFYIGSVTLILVVLAIVHFNFGENYRIFVLTQFSALPLMLISLFMVIGIGNKFENSEIKASKTKRRSYRILKLLIVIFFFSAFTPLLDEFKTLDSKVIGDHKYYLASRSVFDQEKIDHHVYIFECDSFGLICQQIQKYGTNIYRYGRLENLRLVVNSTGKVGYEIRQG